MISVVLHSLEFRSFSVIYPSNHQVSYWVCHFIFSVPNAQDEQFLHEWLSSVFMVQLGHLSNTANPNLLKQHSSPSVWINNLMLLHNQYICVLSLRRNKSGRSPCSPLFPNSKIKTTVH